MGSTRILKKKQRARANKKLENIYFNGNEATLKENFDEEGSQKI